VRDEAGYAPLVGIVDSSERDVFLVFEQPVEVGVDAMELELGENECYVGSNERAVSWGRESVSSRSRLSDHSKQTSGHVPSHRPRARLEPTSLVLSLLDCLVVGEGKDQRGRTRTKGGTRDGVTLLKDLVHGDESLERLHLV
jgi:hypothetical protein